MCPKANLNTHLCSECRKHRKTEKNTPIVVLPSYNKEWTFLLVC
jgi:hypothetical protein